MGWGVGGGGEKGEIKGDLLMHGLLVFLVHLEDIYGLPHLATHPQHLHTPCPYNMAAHLSPC